MAAASDSVVLPQVVLVETDGEPLETPWHFAAIALMIDVVRFHLHGRTDFFVGGNMFIYYSEEQARNRDYRGPDFFFVRDVDGQKERQWWAIWEEDGRYPNLIVELLSHTTARIDRTTKKKLYERTFRTPEYFCYDPADQKLEGWRLDGQGRYKPIKANEHGWLWSQQLGLWVGLWKGKYLDQEGVWPRFYRKDGTLVQTAAEGAQQAAEAAQQRAERAEAELAQLKASLQEQRRASRKNGKQQ